jgi:hypothetical protein
MGWDSLRPSCLPGWHTGVRCTAATEHALYDYDPFGDWVCPKCKISVFAKKLRCVCNAQRT